MKMTSGISVGSEQVTASTSRRDFIASALAAAAAVSTANVRGETANPSLRKGLAVPDGPIFAGMGGAYSAMYTPFFRDGAKAGELNEEMIENLVEYGVRKGLAGMYLTGSTGEGFLLSLDERKRVYARAVKAAKGRLKLIAHVGCLNTDDACELARAAAKAGVDWVSSVAPVYFGQNFDAAFDHYKTISEATDLPFMVYSILGKLNPAQAVRFFELRNVHGMKYTGRDYFELGSLKRMLPKPAIFFAGADEQELNALATGEYAGVIGTTDNQMPAHHVKICRLAAEGRFLEARPYQEDVCRFVEVLMSDANFSTHKSVMKYLGLDCGNARRTAGRPLSAAEYDAYIARVEALGIFRKDDFSR